MTKAQSDIISAALALPPEVRAELAEELLDSLDGPAQAEIDKAWVKEAERRIDQLDRNEAKLVAGDEVIAKLRSRLS